MLATLPPAIAAGVGDPHFFAKLLAQPFVSGIRVALLVCVAMCVLAARPPFSADRIRRRMAVQRQMSDTAIVGEPRAHEASQCA